MTSRPQASGAIQCRAHCEPAPSDRVRWRWPRVAGLVSAGCTACHALLGQAPTLVLTLGTPVQHRAAQPPPRLPMIHLMEQSGGCFRQHRNAPHSGTALQSTRRHGIIIHTTRHGTPRRDIAGMTGNRPRRPPKQQYQRLLHHPCPGHLSLSLFLKPPPFMDVNTWPFGRSRCMATASDTAARAQGSLQASRLWPTGYTNQSGMPPCAAVYRGGVFAKRGHSANYHANYHVVCPGNTPANRPPAEACMIHSKPHGGCRMQDPGTCGYRGGKQPSFRTARAAHGAPSECGGQSCS